MQTGRAASEAAQLVAGQKRRPRHFEGPDVCTQALETIPLPQNCHPQSEEDHQVPAQLQDVQAVSEAVFGNDTEPGPVTTENKLFITRNGRGTFLHDGPAPKEKTVSQAQKQAQ